MHGEKNAPVVTHGHVSNRFCVGKDFFEHRFVDERRRGQVGIRFAATVANANNGRQCEGKNKQEQNESLHAATIAPDAVSTANSTVPKGLRPRVAVRRTMQQPASWPQARHIRAETRETRESFAGRLTTCRCRIRTRSPRDAHRCRCFYLRYRYTPIAQCLRRSGPGDMPTCPVPSASHAIRSRR